ncbi:MAG: AraC family transcriptional regulator [Clostridium sp.]|jgi:AraC-like DNA-binding protein|nr:AraC family transcriptional regulator [Clostridium sp.]
MSDRDSIFTVRKYIDTNYGTAVTIAELARLACMSPSKLKYSFKAHCGKTVFAYLTETRMRSAERLLSGTDLCVAHVAERVGYQKAGAFAAAFRKCTGRLPKEARRSRQAGGRGFL